MRSASTIFAAALLVSACGDEIQAISGTQAAFDTTGGFFDAPFPIVSRVREDGTLRVDDFPNPTHNAMVDDLLHGLSTSHNGLGTNAGVFFVFDGPLDAGRLPTVAGSLDRASPVFLVNVDPDSPERDLRIPIDTALKTRSETYSPENLLAMIPRPGFPLRPSTWYAGVVLAELGDADGDPLGSPLGLEKLKAGRVLDGPYGPEVTEAFALLWQHLRRVELKRQRVRAATVFCTGDPLGEMRRLREHVRARASPAAHDLESLRDHETFCVIEGRVRVPLFQDGERPFNHGGGEIAFGPDGTPKVEVEEEIRFALSIPKSTMPPEGWPLLFYAAGQGGAYTQFVDRGTLEEQAFTQGTGPALYLAAAGIAALSIEAPTVGPRHPSGDTSGFEFFNIVNPIAFRDNVRQAAIDFVTLVRMARGLVVPAALCPGAGESDLTFDPTRFYFYGHSTGATIGSTVLGLEDTLAAGLLSGVGGSWLYNLTIKLEPVATEPFTALMLDYAPDDIPDLYDPILSLGQTLWEPSEPLNWARLWASDATASHVLIIEGVVDGYFPPPMVNALALAARAEPVAPVVEDSLLEALALVNGRLLDAPAGPNRGDIASLLVQHAAPAGGEIDGHDVPFELPGPKYQYRCYFESLVKTGVPLVPAPNPDPLAPCP